METGETVPYRSGPNPFLPIGQTPLIDRHEGSEYGAPRVNAELKARAREASVNRVAESRSACRDQERRTRVVTPQIPPARARAEGRHLTVPARCPPSVREIP